MTETTEAEITAEGLAGTSQGVDKPQEPRAASGGSVGARAGPSESSAIRQTGSSIYEDEERLEDALGTVALPPLSATYFRDRYLPYTRFCEGEARKWRIGYYCLRIPVIILATIVPALVAAHLGTVATVTATVLGVVIASLTATEHFLGVGTRWRHYRPAVELLKSEGWLYLTQSGSYAKSDPQTAAAAFAQQVEQMVRADVSSYVALIAADQLTGAATSGTDGAPAQTPPPGGNQGNVQ